MSALDGDDLEQKQIDAKRAEAVTHEREKEEIADMKWMLSDARGRRIMQRLLERGRVFSPIFAQGEAIYRNAARHDFCLLYLAQVLTANPAALQVMQQEANRKGPRNDD